MDSNEFYDYEDRRYVNPTLSSGEQEQFINNFRDVQNRNNQQIAEQTYNLGKALPSNLGGLGGGEAYFEDRYQTNQVDDMVANLDTAAKAQAFSDVMKNYQDQLKKRYTVAQRNYTRRKANSGSGGGSNLSDILSNLFGDPNKAKGEVEENNVSSSKGNLVERVRASVEDAVKAGYNQSTVAGGPDNRYYYTYNDNNGLVVGTNDPSYKSYRGIYIPSYVYDKIMAASRTPVIGQSLADTLLKNYIKNR